MRDRQGKTAALAMLACMGAVALTLWQWPASTSMTHHPASADVALPASHEGLMPVPMLPPATGGASQPARIDPPRQADTSRRGAPSSLSASAAAVRPIPALETPDLTLIGERLSHVGVTPIASRSLALPMRPVVPERRGMPAVRQDASGNPFAHAGMAIGSAFRRAGVNTGAAFAKIF
jgi:hypothetical protein